MFFGVFFTCVFPRLRSGPLLIYHVSLNMVNILFIPFICSFMYWFTCVPNAFSVSDSLIGFRGTEESKRDKAPHPDTAGHLVAGHHE